MKKTIKGIGILVLALCLSLTMFACGDKDGNGDKDDKAKEVSPIAVQKAASADVETALRAYVADELAYAVEDTDWDSETQQEVIVMRDIVLAEYVGSEAKGEAKLKLSETDAKDLVSAEKYAVKVKIAAATMDGGTPKYEEIAQTVYVLKYGETSYKYAIAEPVTGERITNSCFAKILAAENYTNSTFAMVMKGKDGDDPALAFMGALEMKCTASALYRVSYDDEQRFTARTPDLTPNHDRAGYCVVEKGAVVGVDSQYDETAQKVAWQAYPIEGMETLTQMVQGVLEEYVLEGFNAPALLTRTKDGAEAHITTTETETDPARTTEYKTDIVAKIEDGKVTSIAGATTATTVQGGTTSVEQYESTMTFTDIGKTTVTVPKEVTDAVAAAKAQTPAV